MALLCCNCDIVRPDSPHGSHSKKIENEILDYFLSFFPRLKEIIFLKEL